MSAFRTPDSLARLRQRLAAGEPFDYLCFWGHTPSASGVDKSCLSQWFPAPFEVEGQRYATAEHYMMAEKARLFGDERVRERILRTDDPAQAKALGREVAGFDRLRWDVQRERIVTAGNAAKFAQNPALGAFLLGTARLVLVEASPVDRIWGIGLAENHPDALRPEAWLGLNLLGFALMCVRDRLRPSD